MRFSFSSLIVSAMLAFFGPNTVPAPSTQPIDSAIQRIDASNDPTAIVEAYSDGLSIDRNNVELLDAYVQKMLQLDLPSQAGEAAGRLLDLQPNNAVARMVVADSQARDGDMTDAMTNLAIAAPKLADDPFAQKTAAKLFAWYDNAPQKPPLADSIKKSLDQIRHDWQDLVTYRLAYQEAVAGYQQRSATTQTEPLQDQSFTVPPPVTYESSDLNSSVRESEPSSSYPNYYYPEPYYAPSYDYPPPFFDSYPFFSPGFIFVDRGHQHFDRRGHDGHHFQGSMGHFPGSRDRDLNLIGPRAPGWSGYNATQSGSRSTLSRPAPQSPRSSPQAVPRPAAPRPSPPRPSPARPASPAPSGGSGHHR